VGEIDLHISRMVHDAGHRTRENVRGSCLVGYVHKVRFILSGC
jgi:hypothetical protein